MNRKLTLSLDGSTIEMAKEFAKSKGQSLSEIIENYLKLVSRKNTKSKISAKVSGLKGSISLPKDADYKELLGNAISDKYLK